MSHRTKPVNSYWKDHPELVTKESVKPSRSKYERHIGKRQIARALRGA